MRNFFLVFIFCAVAIAINSNAQQAGTLDTTFGVGGKVVTSLPGVVCAAYSIVLQQDGKIVAGGVIDYNSNPYQLLIRYNADGTLDTGFANAGIDTFPLIDSLNYYFLANPKIAIQPDGKIVGTSCYGMFRCNTDGSLDTSFGVNGISSEGIGSSFALLPGGKFIVAREGLFVIRRINSDGSIDSTFGNNGQCYRIFYPGQQERSATEDAEILPDGKIMVVGCTGVYDSPITYKDYAFARIDSNGFFDNSFGVNGVQVLDLGDDDETVWGLALLPRNYVAIGFFSGVSGVGNKLFGIPSVMPANTGFLYNDLSIQSDEKILAVGGNDHFDLAVARYTRTGLDSSFGIGGMVLVTIDSLSRDLGLCTAIQADGKIIAGGISDTNILIVRFNNCGAQSTAVNPCAFNCNGSISMTPAFGVSPFTYFWSTGDTVASIDSLCEGDYSVTISDSSGCISTYNYNLVVPWISIINTATDCFGLCHGTASVSFNGSPPFTYLWNTGDTTDTLTNLCSGNYTVIVSDSNQCSDTATTYVAHPNYLNPVFTGIDVFCNGECNGSFVSNVSGGTAPYIYSICGGGNLIPDSLCAGNYCVTIIDSHGCDTTGSLVVNEPPAIYTSSSVQNPNCTGCYNGAIVFSVSGGVPPYTYAWSPQTGHISNDSLINLPAGIYTFIITDVNGCIASFIDTLVDQPDFVGELNQQNDFEIIPNPTTGKFEIRMLIDTGTKCIIESIEIFNLVGEKEYTAFDINYQTCIIDCSAFPRGIYFLKLNSEKVNCVKKLVIE